jgi:FlaA1/EpsC-like NDP-sugar epimerase
MPRFRNRYLLILDIVLCALTPAVALLLRQNVARWLPEEARGLAVYTILSLLIKIPVFFRYGLYSRFWRYAGIGEMISIASAVSVATLRVFAVVLAERVLNPFPTLSVPLSVPLIDGLLTLLAVGATRFSERAGSLSRRRSQLSEPSGRKRVLIVGAGDAGSMIVQEMLYSDKIHADPLGFVDDDPEKQGILIHGLRVWGVPRDIPRLVRELKVQEVIIAMPTAPGRVIRQVVSLCEVAKVPSRTMPGMYDILTGRVGINQLRNVEIEDLLRRDPVKTDMASVTEFLSERRVLVTGAGGSIGSELCRQILRCGPTELVLLGHGENSVFDILSELQGIVGQMRKENRFTERVPVLRPVIADIRFGERLHAIFEEHRPEIVFHAAAHKHVPLMEANVAEAVTNNVLGSRNLINTALATNVKHFVLISTDKAVNPTSIMGACKRSAELLVRQAALASGKAYVAVRFGNVLGSRGSVVLTFRKQIASGGPVTVTHPDMQRYFMVIPEAVQLVLQAAVVGRGGEVFMLDMGEPVRIVDLAKDMIRLSGLEVGRDVEINYVGVRPGEKLFEELFGPGENYEHTTHEKIFIASNASAFVPAHLEENIVALEQASRRNDTSAILGTLRTLVPEFSPVREEKGAEAPGARELVGSGEYFNAVVPRKEAFEL